MRTQMMIMAIVLAIMVAAIGILVGLILWIGWLGGLAVGLGAVAVLVALYMLVIRPWHIRWGASDEEVVAVMPGDGLISDAGQATHAITVAAKPGDIWPWLVQLGYGKAGWYSYDWIDNDFRKSADRILPEYQTLATGDQILMMPGMGFTVVAVDSPHSIVSILSEGGTTSWCLALNPMDDGRTRIVSRWRPKFELTLGTVFFTALTDPGAFIMEQKMLKTIRKRVESSVQAAH